MRILIIDQCSKSKAHGGNDTVFDIDDIKEQSREELIAQPGVPTWPARQLYTGRQQQYINDAVEALRDSGHTVDRYFISAGFGLIGENTELPPYGVTFAEMNDQAIKQRAQELNLSHAIHQLITKTEAYDMLFLTLGRDYYLGLAIDDVLETISDESIAVLFNHEEHETRWPNVISIPARTEQARSHGSIVVALKGVYLQNFATHLAQGGSVTTLEDVRRYCTTDPITQTDFDQYE